MPNKKFYVTTAIDYVNAPAHAGHAYEKVLADAVARFNRLRGWDVFFQTGTDDNAAKNEESAIAAGIPVRTFVDTNAQAFVELCTSLNISQDNFIRTVDPQHTQVAQKIFQTVYDKGDIYKGMYEGLYCTGCEAFYTETQLENRKCPEHNKELEVLREESFFFKLSKYKVQVQELIKSGLIVPKSKANEILARLKNDELQDLSVSRIGKQWGIKTPIDEKHTIYVWFDALINYYSSVQTIKRKHYWPADVHVIGKGINWFHSVIWPAMLLSAGIPVPKQVAVHGYLTVNGKKIGKSLGNAEDPLIIIKKYGSDAVRYHFLREISFGDDGDFSETRLVERYNDELANELGNLVSRLVTLIEKKCHGTIPKAPFNKLFTDEELKVIEKHVDAFELHKALDHIFVLLKSINKHLNDKEPWKEKDQKKIDTTLYTCVDALRLVTIPLSAFIPDSCEKIATIFGFNKQNFTHFIWGLLKQNKVKKAALLFPKIEQNIVSVFPLHLKVGRVLSVEAHPNADNLYVLKVDIGKEIQLVAGIKTWYTPEQLKGHTIIVVSNMKSAKLRGVKSEGMLLTGEYKHAVVLLTTTAEPGTIISVEGYENNTAQIKYEQFVATHLVIKGKVVYYDETQLKAGDHVISVDMPDGSAIK